LIRLKDLTVHVFLDTDIGSDVDDALALAVIAGSPELHLDGISTVYGDTRLRAQLARRYLSYMGLDPSLPIGAGAEETRSGRAVWWAGHEGGLFSDLAEQDVDDRGVDLLIDTVSAHAGDIDVLAIGPLTNIAAALDADPEFERNVRRLVVMGGDFRPDGTAEHNIKSDVAAARRVFGSDLRIVAGGLDLTLRVTLGAAQVAAIAAAGPLGEIFAQEIAVWWKFLHEEENSPHDPILALWLANRSGFTSRQARVIVDDEGRTEAVTDAGGNVSVLDVVDTTAVRDEIVRRIVAGATQVAVRT
jgi:purine nucleosidase